MDIKKMSKLKESLLGAADAAKDKAKELAAEVKEKAPEKIADVKIPKQVRGVLAKKDKTKLQESEATGRKGISTRNAIKIIYYLMAADGEILDSEDAKFRDIGASLDPAFSEHKDSIINECRSSLEVSEYTGDSFDAVWNGVDDAIRSSVQTEDTFITPKLLTWDLLTVAYSDNNYDEKEQKIINHIVEVLNVDKTVFLEMESSIMTMMDLEKELSWIKTTDRPYLTIEAMVNEIQDRKNVIFESIKDLIVL